jgi:hypothetical protein
MIHYSIYILPYSTFAFFGKNKLKSSDTTNTPVTAFPLNTSPTALGNAAKNHLYQYSLE